MNRRGAAERRVTPNSSCLAPPAHGLLSAAPSDGEFVMAKGQMRSNKEKRKPKKDKGDKKPADKK